MATDIDRLKIWHAGLIAPWRWNELIDIVHSGLISGFVGGSYERSLLGTQLKLLDRGGGGSGSASPFPWQLKPVVEEIDGGFDGRLAIQYGEIDSVPPSGMTDDGSGDTFTIDPLDGTNGTSWIYIIITFDTTTRQINSRTIGYTASGADVPANTHTTKYVVIGQVQFTETGGDAPGYYTVLSQEISQSLYTDQAYYLSDGENTFFADENSVQLVDTTYTARLESSSLTITDYPIVDGSGDGEQILLEVDDVGTAKIHAQAGGDGGATFDLLADDVTGEASLILDDGDDSVTTLNTSQLLFNDGDGETLTANIDKTVGAVQVMGHAGSSAQNFQLTANDTLGISSLTLMGNDFAQDLVLQTNNGNFTQINGYAGGAGTGPTFDLIADDDAGEAMLTLDDGDGNTTTTSTSEYIIFDYTSGESVTINMPTNADGDTVSASWQEIAICAEDGSVNHMKVLGTDLY